MIILLLLTLLIGRAVTSRSEGESVSTPTEYRYVENLYLIANKIETPQARVSLSSIIYQKSFSREAEEVIEKIRLLSVKYSLDFNCFNTIIRCESGYRNVCNADYGCWSGTGPGQLTPGKKEYCGKKLGREINLNNIDDNLECSAWLIANEGTRHYGTEETWWGSWDCFQDACLNSL